MNENENKPPESSQEGVLHQLENGIFSFTVQLCQQVALRNNDMTEARKYVAKYLEDLAQGLHDLNEKESQ